MATNPARMEFGSIVERPATSGSSLSVDFSVRKRPDSTHSTEVLVRNENKDAEPGVRLPVVASTEEIALQALHIDDDPTLNPWTFRMYFLGEFLT
jgi:hypothetical protein